MIRITVFLAASVVLAYISRKCLVRPRCHGFYRFFAWELSVAMLLLNVTVWQSSVLALRFIPSAILFAISAGLALHAFHVLRVIGKPNSSRAEGELLPFERTQVLVTVGAYKSIRHPLVSSYLAGTWGFSLMLPTWTGLALVLAITACLCLAALSEEAECRRYFGPAYDAYMQATKRFIPAVV
jgi:protein-S-isoprenylcysteine O-methyltransferase Ste14